MDSFNIMVATEQFLLENNFITQEKKKYHYETKPKIA